MVDGGSLGELGRTEVGDVVDAFTANGCNDFVGVGKKEFFIVKAHIADFIAGERPVAEVVEIDASISTTHMVSGLVSHL